MSEKFATRLDTVLAENFSADPTMQKQDLVRTAQELLDNIGQWKQSISDAEIKLNHILEELNASLGREIRKIQPKMSIGLRNGSCSCGYHSRDIVCKPDIDKGIWVVSGRMGNSFKRRNPEMLRLSHDLRPLAKAIVGLFQEKYRTL